MGHFGFFCSSIATLNPPLLLCSTCLTFLLNVFLTIHLVFLSILKKFTELKKEPWWSSFGKVVGLQHPNLLKRNPKMSVLLGVTDIIFWGISGNSYYMESLQIIDKFCSSHLLIFLNMAYLQSQRSYKKPKDIQSSLHFLSPRSFHKVLIFCILLSNFLTGSCCFSIHILKVKFWLL